MPVFGRDGIAYARRVGKLSVLQRAVLEVALSECKVSANGVVRRLDGQELPWPDLLDALILADLFCAKVASAEGFPLASKVVEKIPGGDVGERALNERAEVLSHWLDPVRVWSILQQMLVIMDTDRLLHNAKARTRDD